MHGKTVLVPLERPLGVLKGLEHQLLLALGLQAGLLRQVTGRSGQPPQELGIVASRKRGQRRVETHTHIHYVVSNFAYSLLRLRQHVFCGTFNLISYIIHLMWGESTAR